MKNLSFYAPVLRLGLNDNRFRYLVWRGILYLAICGSSRSKGNIVKWDQSNRAYIMTHGVSGIDWKHYKHPLPENVNDVYMKCQESVSFTAWLPCQILNWKFLELTLNWYYGGPFTNPVPRARLFALLQELPQTTRSRRRWGDTPHRKDCRSRRQWWRFQAYIPGRRYLSS